MGKAFVAVCLSLFSISVFAFDFTGEWHSSLGGKIKIYKTNSQYISHNKKTYVDSLGDTARGETHYHGGCDVDANATQFTGSLSTVDTYWNCQFENGAVHVDVISDRKVLVSYPQITFKKITRKRTSRQRKRFPIKCQYQNEGETVEYICGWEWDWETVVEANLGTECKVTNTNYVPVELYKIK